MQLPQRGYGRIATAQPQPPWGRFDCAHDSQGSPDFIGTTLGWRPKPLWGITTDRIPLRLKDVGKGEPLAGRGNNITHSPLPGKGKNLSTSPLEGKEIQSLYFPILMGSEPCL